MRAAVLHEIGAEPRIGTIDDPPAGDGQAVVEVAVAGLNPVDLTRAAGRMGDPPLPSVVGREGVGRLLDGRRVYFNPSIDPYGSWAERTLVDPDTVFDVPDDLSDDLAVSLGIAGLAAWLSVDLHARIGKGDRVLVLGATGVVGRIAVQGAKILGADHVVAAGRHADALEQVVALGADATVTLGAGDDAEALREAGGDGFDVVIDPLYGAPFLAALAATSAGARIVTVGQSAGPTAEIAFRALQGRVHFAHGNNQTPLEVRADAYATLAGHAAAGRIVVDVERYPLDRGVEAWRAQAESPHRKLVVVP